MRLLAVVIGLSALLCACGDDDDPAASGSAATTTGAGAAGAASATGGGGAGASGGSGGSGSGGRPSNGCDAADSTLAAGDHDVTLTHDGVERAYVVHVPTSYQATTATRLVLNFHGYTSNPGQQATFSAMNATSEAEGFVVVYPAGIQSSWNGGICCGSAASDDIDDVGFARAVVADVSAKLCIDDKRVYSTGMSNGGYLSQRLGCEAADLFAAIAPVAGVMGIPEADCKPSRPMPIIHFYGTADTLVPYEGGGALGSPSAADTNAGWVARNGCSGAAVETYNEGVAHCETHETCEAGVRVTLCTIEGGGHCWPGQAICPFGSSTTDISANTAMWALFQDFALP
jgi:polyhydroxybutyrate depolymerase